MITGTCDQCGKDLGVLIAEGVAPATLALFERGHQAVCVVVRHREKRWFNEYRAHLATVKHA